MKIVVKYNKKTIMTQAHKFFADGRMGTWSVCLKKAWANAKAVKTTIETIGEEAKTYGQWLASGYEVIHGEHNVGQCIVNSVRYAKKTIETLSFFTWGQVVPVGTQADKA
jgi:hypothetical protein